MEESGTVMLWYLLAHALVLKVLNEKIASSRKSIGSY
jgi:hypothetical protein